MALPTAPSSSVDRDRCAMRGRACQTLGQLRHVGIAKDHAGRSLRLGNKTVLMRNVGNGLFVAGANGHHDLDVQAGGLRVSDDCGEILGKVG